LMYRNWYPSTLLVGIQNGVTFMGNSIEVLQTIKDNITIWPRNPTVGIC
jgi:hypothetical protein